MTLPDETRTDVREFATDASERKVPHILVAPDVILALLDEIDQLRAEAVQSRNAIDHYVGALGVERLNAHNEYQRAEKAEAAVDRVRALAAQIDREATAPTDYRGIRRAHANRIRATLEGEA